MLPINVNLPLKSVTDRSQSCRAVQWAIDTHGAILIDKLGESFDSLLDEGQAMPFATQLELFKKRLTLDLQQVVNADREYRDQKARESISRGLRDHSVDSVNSGTIGLRQTFTGFYSEDKLAEFGFPRRMPTRSEELRELASHLAVRLNDPDLDLSGSNFEDYQLEAPRLAAKLVQAVSQLQQATDDLAREERKTEVLKLAKDNALNDYNSSFLWIARTLESLCRLAGLEEVAKRVRPSTRRPGTTEKEFKPTSDTQSGGEGESGADPEGSSESSSESESADTSTAS